MPANAECSSATRLIQFARRASRGNVRLLANGTFPLLPPRTNSIRRQAAAFYTLILSFFFLCVSAPLR